MPAESITLYVCPEHGPRLDPVCREVVAVHEGVGPEPCLRVCPNVEFAPVSSSGGVGEEPREAAIREAVFNIQGELQTPIGFYRVDHGDDTSTAQRLLKTLAMLHALCAALGKPILDPEKHEDVPYPAVLPAAPSRVGEDAEHWRRECERSRARERELMLVVDSLESSRGGEELARLREWAEERGRGLRALESMNGPNRATHRKGADLADEFIDQIDRLAASAPPAQSPADQPPAPLDPGLWVKQGEYVPPEERTSPPPAPSDDGEPEMVPRSELDELQRRYDRMRESIFVAYRRVDPTPNALGGAWGDMLRVMAEGARGAKPLPPSSSGGGEEPRRFVKLTDDRHQQALYRLAAVGQYLYDTMGGDAESNPSNRPDGPPLPDGPMVHVRAAQEQIAVAIKMGQRARRQCLGGEIELHEHAHSASSVQGDGEAREAPTVASLRASLPPSGGREAEIRATLGEHAYWSDPTIRRSVALGRQRDPESYAVGEGWGQCQQDGCGDLMPCSRHTPGGLGDGKEASNG